MTRSIEGWRERAEAVEALEPLIVHLAGRYRPWAMEWEDACQEARLAAVIAVDSYEEGRGAKLSTWVTMRIMSRFRDLSHRVIWRDRPRVEVSVAGFEIPAPDTSDATMSQALVLAILRAFPPPLRVRQALLAVTADVPIRAASRSLGLNEETLFSCLSNWRRRIRSARPDLFLEADASDGGSVMTPSSSGVCSRGHDRSRWASKSGHCRLCQAEANKRSYEKRKER